MFPNAQDALPLPRRPNVERYKNLARDLVKACKSGDEDAIVAWSERWVTSLANQCGVEFRRPLPVIVSRWANQLAGFIRRAVSEHDGRCALADAQLILARSHGFVTWARFAKHLNGLTEKSSAIARFETAADAIIKGDIKMLKRLLREDPRLVYARSTREHGATLLHYASANGVEGYRQKTPANILEVTELLLQSGAEVDAEADVYGGGATTLGLVATSVHPFRAGVQNPLLQLLLDYGAEIDHKTSAGNRQGSVMGALANGRPEAAAYLAERGARLNLEAAAGVGRLDVVKRLLDGFEADTNRLVAEISAALTARKYEAVRDAAHALKGGAASVGATQLTQLARRLEQSAPESLRIKSAQFIEELLKTSNYTLELLRRHLNGTLEQNDSSSTQKR